jgi:hypothetical protein
MIYKIFQKEKQLYHGLFLPLELMKNDIDLPSRKFMRPLRVTTERKASAFFPAEK